MRTPETFDLDEHNERMGREAERAYYGTLGQGRARPQEMVVRREITQPDHLPAGVMHPLEVAPADFKRSLAVRGENRNTLVTWLKDALVVGTDYGRIHYVKKSVCDLGAACKNPEHFTKDTLFKPGAQKICGMLGVTPTYPNLPRYEEAALEGVAIKSVILRCQIVSVDGRVLAEGVGARSLQQDYGDLNKSLKMAAKSAHIDATLQLAGLSEIFSHPDNPAGKKGEEEPDPARCQNGKYKGTFWTDVPQDYLLAVVNSERAPAAIRMGAQAELARRPKAPPEEEFDDDIPF